MKDNIKKALYLTQDLIKLEEARDDDYRKLMIKINKSEQAAGISPVLHYLGLLEELLQEEYDKNEEGKVISVSIVKELVFLAKGTNSKIKADISSPSLKHPITLLAQGDFINISYNSFLIWGERVLVPQSNFGIESITTILHIMFLIDKGDPSYKNYIYLET